MLVVHHDVRSVTFVFLQSQSLRFSLIAVMIGALQPVVCFVRSAATQVSPYRRHGCGARASLKPAAHPVHGAQWLAGGAQCVMRPVWLGRLANAVRANLTGRHAAGDHRTAMHALDHARIARMRTAFGAEALAKLAPGTGMTLVVVAAGVAAVVAARSS